MDAKLASEPLKYQTWFLKVSIHCEGCRRKVKKVLRSIDGVFTATIDPNQQKVTVTGNVTVETLLRKLVKAGKHAEIWPENLDGKGKSSGKEKNKNEPKETQSLQNKGTENAAKCVSKSKNQSSNSKTSGGDSPGKSPAGNRVPPESSRGGGGSGNNNKKNKKKDQGGSGNGGNGSINGLSLTSESKSGLAHTGFQFQNQVQGVGQQVNLSPTRQLSFSYSETGYPPMVYVAAYNRSYPMGSVGGPSYYVPSSPYMCAGNGIDQYDTTNQFQSPPLVSFEIFSDENANGCSIM